MEREKSRSFSFAYLCDILVKNRQERDMEKKQKEKKIVFSEEIDSLISGLTLGFAFVME